VLPLQSDGAKSFGGLGVGLPGTVDSDFKNFYIDLWQIQTTMVCWIE
jgi:hypothetical protein